MESVPKPDEACRALGRKLAELRRAAGMNQHVFAPLTGYGRSTVANVETGRQRVPRRFWERCDDALGAQGALMAQFETLDSRRPLPSHETNQPPASAGGALCASHGPSDSVIMVEGPVNPALVPHWAGLLRVLGAAHDASGPRHLHDVARGELALISRNREAAGGETQRGLLHVEARWAEFASWTADNLGDRQNAAYWLRVALSLARQAESRFLVAYVMMRQAQRAVERRDASEAMTLAEAAGRYSGLPARDRALCAVRCAQGGALAGDRVSAQRALRQAYRLVAHADATEDCDDPETIGHHCVRAYVAAHEGFCQLSLGEPGTAVTILEDVLRGWPPAYRQDEGLARTWLGAAYADVGRIGEAAAQGHTAMNLAIEAGSVRTARALRRLDVALASHGGVPDAAGFRSRYAMVRELTGRLAS